MPSWIRIRIRNLNTDPDPATQINADPDTDPDPKPWTVYFFQQRGLTFVACGLLLLYFAEFPLFSVPCQLVREIIEAKVEKWSIPPKHLALAFAVSDPPTHTHILPSYASPCILQCNFFYY
jgi:hypothetical protein